MNGFSMRLLGLMAGVMLALSACPTAPASEQDNANIETEAAAAVAKARTSNPALANILDGAAGYAVFPSVSKGAMGIGAAQGSGVLYVGGKVVGYCDLSQATIGLQLGGQVYTEMIAFETPQAVETFKQGNYRFDAQATAVALKSGAGVDAKYTNGVAVFTMDQGGLMFEAAIGGQKFGYRAK